jgi:hypothetical protein
MIYLLCYWCKHQSEEKVLAACVDKKQVYDVCDGLNGTIGYISGMGTFSQKADGRYSVREVPLVDPEKLEGRFQEWLDKRRSDWL